MGSSYQSVRYIISIHVLNEGPVCHRLQEQTLAIVWWLLCYVVCRIRFWFNIESEVRVYNPW